MENRQKPAFYNPNSYTMQGDDGIGLTKREYFAALAMQGLLACPDLHLHGKTIAEESLFQTDELLKALETNPD
jgi:hypothetical protein